MNNEPLRKKGGSPLNPVDYSKSPSYMQSAPNQQFYNQNNNQSNKGEIKPKRKRKFLRFLRNYFIIVGMLTTAYFIMRGIIELLVLLNMAQNTVK